MNTAVVDSKHRVRIPGLKPGAVVAYSDNRDGSYTLIKVRAEAKEPFPEGSLKHLVTKARNAELDAIAKGCLLGPGGSEE